MSLIHFKNIIFNSDVTVFTDHSNLKFLETPQLQRIQRWRILIEEYNPKIVYLKGSENLAADFLSRCFSTSVLERGKENLHKEIKIFHHNLAHPGAKRLYKTIQYLLDGITRADVEKVSECCNTCMENKNIKNVHGYLKGSIVFSNPWEKICVDIIGPLELENNSKIYLFHIIDQSTRLSELKRMKFITAQEAVKIHKKEWFMKYPLPKTIVSDNGKQFTSKKFESLLKEFNVEHQKQ